MNNGEIAAVICGDFFVKYLLGDVANEYIIVSFNCSFSGAFNDKSI